MFNGRFSLRAEEGSALSPSFLLAAVPFAAAGVLYNFEQHFLPRFPRGCGSLQDKSSGRCFCHLHGLGTNSRGPHYPKRCSNPPRTGQLVRRRKGWLRASLGSGRLRSHPSSLKLCNEGHYGWGSDFSQPGGDPSGQTRSSSRPFPSEKRAGRNPGACGWMEATSGASGCVSPRRGRGRAPPAGGLSLQGPGRRRSQCGFTPGDWSRRVAMTAAGVNRAAAGRPQARAASPRADPPRRRVRPPAPGSGKGPGQRPDAVRGSEDGCGAEQRAAAAAAGGERGGRLLRLARGPLS